MTEHTPGPWGVFDSTDIWPTDASGAIVWGDGYIARLRLKGTGVEVNDPGPYSYRFPEAEANALLIAAAPDLLSAAKAAMAALESGKSSDAIAADKLLAAAIEKAGAK